MGAAEGEPLVRVARGGPVRGGVPPADQLEALRLPALPPRAGGAPGPPGDGDAPLRLRSGWRLQLEPAADQSPVARRGGELQGSGAVRDVAGSGPVDGAGR